MRVPLMPLAMALAVGGLLYAAFQGNKRIVERAGTGPALAALAAPGVAVQAAEQEPPETALVDTSDLDERCAAIAATAAAAAAGLEDEVPLETLLRRAVIAFEDDAALRAELEQLAARVYAEPPVAPGIAQRRALATASCP